MAGWVCAQLRSLPKWFRADLWRAIVFIIRGLFGDWHRPSQFDALNYIIICMRRVAPPSQTAEFGEEKGECPQSRPPFCFWELKNVFYRHSFTTFDVKWWGGVLVGWCGRRRAANYEVKHFLVRRTSKTIHSFLPESLALNLSRGKFNKSTGSLITLLFWTWTGNWILAHFLFPSLILIFWDPAALLFVVL